MKKLFLLASLAISFSLYAEEIVIQNFESGFSGTWGTNGNSGTSPDENHDNFSIVNNPSKIGINESNKVGKFHRLQSGNWWALAWFEFPEIQVEATLSKPKYLHISVYKSVASTVCLQMKDLMIDPTSNTGEMKNDKQTKVNEWQDLVFKLTSSGVFRIVEIKPDFINQPLSERLDGDIDIYFDNIVINDDPTPLGEEPEPLPEFKGVLPEGFEGINTLLDQVFYEERFGTFGQNSDITSLVVTDNPAKVGINTTNKCAKFTRKVNGEWWAGAYMMPQNQIVVDSDNKYLHIMVYREFDATPLSLKLENSTGNTGDIVLEGDEAGIYDWVDYVFEIPADKYGVYDKIAFMPDFINDPAPADRFIEDVAIYFDAIEVSNDATPRTSGDITSLGDEEHLLNIDVRVDNMGNIQISAPSESTYSVQLYNAMGVQVGAMSDAGSEGQILIQANHLKGVLLVKVVSADGIVYTAKVCL